MKIDIRQLANQAIRIGGPIVLAAIAHKLATTKPADASATSTTADLKTLGLELATNALATRVAAIERGLAPQAGQ